jgi:hypothetical protein
LLPTSLKSRGCYAPISCNVGPRRVTRPFAKAAAFPQGEASYHGLSDRQRPRSRHRPLSRQAATTVFLDRQEKPSSKPQRSFVS